MGIAPRAAKCGKVKKLLWTNPAVETAFAAQSISIPGLSKYAEVYCEFGTDAAVAAKTEVCLCSGSFCLGYRVGETGKEAFRIRPGERNGDKIVFYKGRYLGESSTTATVYNTVCIPHKIYALI